MFSKTAIFLLRGGLGNQLFQFCALGQLSKDIDIRLYVSDIDTHGLTRGSGGTESLELDIGSLFGPGNTPVIMGAKTRTLVRFLVASNKRLGLPSFIYVDDLKTLELNRFFLMQGYFQNFRIPAAFNLSTLNTFIFGSDSLQSSERIKDVACVHIRRSDYPLSGIARYDRNYYLNAIDDLARLGIRTFDCYSDDLVAAQELFPKSNKIKVRFPERESKLTSIELLRKMSLYNYTIASQSSLSWWSSYMAFRNYSKVVIKSNWNHDLDFFRSNNY